MLLRVLVAAAWIATLVPAAPPGRTTAASRRDGRAVWTTVWSDAAVPAGSSRSAVALRVARDQIGKPYRWAAAGPEAFDCSGLTAFAWRAAGIELPRASARQFDLLPQVPLDAMRPGDLVYSPGHIGIYAGDGLMVHAPRAGRAVELTPLPPNAVGASRPAV